MFLMGWLSAPHILRSFEPRCFCFPPFFFVHVLRRMEKGRKKVARAYIMTR